MLNEFSNTVKELVSDVRSDDIAMRDKIFMVFMLLFLVSVFFVAATLIIIKFVYLFPIACVGAFFLFLGAFSFLTAMFVEPRH